MRSQRPLILLIGLVSVLVGLGVVAWIGAPPQLLGVVAAGIVGILVSIALSLLWKVSLHMAVLAGAVVLLMWTMSPWCAMVALLLVPVGWARLRLRDHTRGQVLAGAAVGATIAAAVYPLVTLPHV